MCAACGGKVSAIGVRSQAISEIMEAVQGAALALEAVDDLTVSQVPSLLSLSACRTI